MLLTEEEARKKWCCNGREGCSRNEFLEVFGKDETRYYAPRCIASCCMAWRWWLDPEHVFAINESGEIGSITNPRIEGFCGLAGTPGVE